MDEEKALSREEAEALLREDDPLDGTATREDMDTEAARPSTTRKGPSVKLWLCITVNVLATISIVSRPVSADHVSLINGSQVFTNKHIFDTSPLRQAQVTYAAFHFSITALMLWLLSRPFIGVFEAKPLQIWRTLPLSLAMILNVVLQNAALAYSSVQFAQLARILLTPGCVMLNYILYRTTITRRAALALIPVCLGVAVVSYYEPHQGPTSTTPLGVVLTFSAVSASVVYTVSVRPFHEKLDCNSTQLLLNQSVISVVLMLYIIPFTDNLHFWEGVSSSTWMLVALSGVLASIINLSMIMLINQAGPVTSTVVGHLKNCSIVFLGWVTSQRSIHDASVIGFVVAIAGIISYTYVTRNPK